MNKLNHYFAATVVTFAASLTAVVFIQFVGAEPIGGRFRNQKMQENVLATFGPFDEKGIAVKTMSNATCARIDQSGIPAGNGVGQHEAMNLAPECSEADQLP